MCTATSRLFSKQKSGNLSSSPSASPSSSSPSSGVRRSALKSGARRRAGNIVKVKHTTRTGRGTASLHAPISMEGDALLTALAHICKSLPAGSDRSKTGVGAHLKTLGIPVETAFDAVSVKGENVETHLKKLGKHFHCQEACIISAMIYLDRICKLHPSSVDQFSIHRLLSVSLMVSVKFHDDEYYTNEYYAKGVGMSLKDINSLEVKFLSLIQWRLDVSPEEYSHYLQFFAAVLSEAAAAAGA